MRESTFTVDTTGIGKPDYSQEVSSARERKGFTLKYNESLVALGYVPTDQVVHPYAIPWVQPVLAPGLSAHMIDTATGIATPYTVPLGYTLTEIYEGYTHNQDIEVWIYVDTFLMGCFSMGNSGRLDMIDSVIPFTTEDYDPTGASTHAVDVILTNVGGNNLEGGVWIGFILKAVSTPPLPTIKQTRCPLCGNIQDTAIGTSQIICTKCGKLYIVKDFSHLGHIAHKGGD